MFDISALRLVVAAFVVVTTTAFLRLLYILPSTSRPHLDPRIQYPKKGPSHVVVVLGSGGHTAEMMSLLRDLSPRTWFHRTYVASSGDAFSFDRAHAIEARIQRGVSRGSGPFPEGIVHPLAGKWEVKTVPRARKIHQSLFTTPISSLWCLIGCLSTLLETARKSAIGPREYPDLIVANGPATAVIMILASVILKFLGLAPLWKMKIIYIESWARVKTLSLSGRILAWMGVCDKFVVQWEELEKKLNKDGTKKNVINPGFLVEI